MSLTKSLIDKIGGIEINLPFTVFYSKGIYFNQHNKTYKTGMILFMSITSTREQFTYKNNDSEGQTLELNVTHSFSTFNI